MYSSNLSGSSSAFYNSLTRHPKERNEEDVNVIYNYLRRLDVFERLHDAPLRSVCKTARLERHAPNHMLFRKGQVATCWYILLSGSVFMNKQVYLPVGCFGKRSNMNLRRNSDCIVIQPSDMIVIDYPDAQRIPVTAGSHHHHSPLPPSSLPSSSTIYQHHHRRPPIPIAQQHHRNGGYPLPIWQQQTPSSSNHLHYSQNSLHYHAQKLNAMGPPPVMVSEGDGKFRRPGTVHNRVPSPAPSGDERPGQAGSFWINRAYPHSVPYAPPQPPPKPAFMRRGPSTEHYPLPSASSAPMAASHFLHQRSGSSSGIGGSRTEAEPPPNSNFSLVTSSSAASVQPAIERNNFHAAIYHNIKRAADDPPLKAPLSPPSPAPIKATAVEPADKQSSSTMGPPSAPFQRRSNIRMASRRESADDIKTRSANKAGTTSSTGGSQRVIRTSRVLTGGGTSAAQTMNSASATPSNASTATDEFAGLPETAVDVSEGEDGDEAEDEDESCPSHDSFQELRDNVRECLVKEPCERNSDDIAILMDFIQHMKALALLPMSIKRQLCLKMFFAVVPQGGTPIMSHGERIDAWSVVVNGCVEWQKQNGERVEYRVGDSFGVGPDPEPQCQEGELRTTMDDCEFVLVEHSDYCAIMSTLSDHIEKEADGVTGEVVREAERRIIGTQVELLITKALPDRLIQHLLDDADSPAAVIDTHYVEDFLLMYRVFIIAPTRIMEKLLLWFDEDDHNEQQLKRVRVAQVVLLWVNNHFNDFDADKEMTKHLDTFDTLLERHSMSGQQSLLSITRSMKSRPRTITISRSNRNQELSFSLVADERSCTQGVFVTSVEPESAAEKNGLSVGDEVLEANGQKMKGGNFAKALERMRESTHLSLLVKSNLIGYRQMLHSQQEAIHPTDMLLDGVDECDNATAVVYYPGSANTNIDKPHHVAGSNGNAMGRYQKRNNLHTGTAAAGPGGGRRSTLNIVDVSSAATTRPPFLTTRPPPVGSATPSNSEAGSFTSSAGGSSMFGKLKTILKGGYASTSNSANHHERQHSGDANATSLEHEVGSLSLNNALRTSRSNPDISIHQCNASTSNRHSSVTFGSQPAPPTTVGEQAVKIFKADQSYRYLTVYPETTAKNIVQLALQEFGMSASADSTSLDWALCECSVTREGVIKQRRLPPDMANLAERNALNSRLYLKNNHTSETLIPDELAPEVMKDARLSLYTLNAQFIAVQLTLQDFEVFASIEATEYVDNLFQLDTRDGWPHLALFESLFNREMWWVVTEVCYERNVYRRAKLLKKFIKIARQCRDLRNFNSMFAIMSGLEKPAVRRLTHTWDRVPGKHLKMFSDLQQLMDPSRNMSKYRQHLAQVALEPPVIPIYPVLRKDLTFSHEANPTFCGKLVNFEKLRMIARIVRSVCRLSAVHYDVDLVSSASQTAGVDGMAMMGAAATIRRMGAAATLTQSSKSVISGQSRKKLYERTLMLRKVKAYLANMPFVDDESELDRLSDECEPNPPSTSSTTGMMLGIGGGAGLSGSAQQPRKRMPSPSPSSLSSHSTQSGRAQHREQLQPKFGVESPQAVQKMLSLVQNSRLKPGLGRGPQHLTAPAGQSVKRIPSFGRAATQAALPPIDKKRNSLTDDKS